MHLHISCAFRQRCTFATNGSRKHSSFFRIWLEAWSTWSCGLDKCWLNSLPPDIRASVFTLSTETDGSAYKSAELSPKLTSSNTCPRHSSLKEKTCGHLAKIPILAADHSRDGGANPKHDNFELHSTCGTGGFFFGVYPAKASSNFPTEFTVINNAAHRARPSTLRTPFLPKLSLRSGLLDSPTDRRPSRQTTDLLPAKIHFRIYRHGRGYNGNGFRRCICDIEETANYMNTNIELL